jgi:hypothetical protein
MFHNIHHDAGLAARHEWHAGDGDQHKGRRYPEDGAIALDTTNASDLVLQSRFMLDSPV